MQLASTTRINLLMVTGLVVTGLALAMPATALRSEPAEQAVAHPAQQKKLAAREDRPLSAIQQIAARFYEWSHASADTALFEEWAARRRGKKPEPPISILQVGDSHTAADFFTGELRRQLQGIHGAGGSGYIAAGRPHVGILHAAVKITASQGWTYEALQKSDDPKSFWISGFNAVTSNSGETLKFKASGSFVYDSIDIDLIRQPGGGTIDIQLDGKTVSSENLAAEETQPRTIRVFPQRGQTERVSEVAIVGNGGKVAISGLSINNSRTGASFSHVGYPGATIDILNKMDETLLATYVRRSNPQVVILAFGTNEATKSAFSSEVYAEKYQQAIDRLKRVAPSATIVVIAPPDGAERGPDCKGRSQECQASMSEAEANERCMWQSLPKLAQVREVQKELAARNGLIYWDWASIMPAKCGANKWATLSSPLMAKDRVHFTIEGYKKSANEFLHVLKPIVASKVAGREQQK